MKSINISVIEGVSDAVVAEAAPFNGVAVWFTKPVPHGICISAAAPL